MPTRRVDQRQPASPEPHGRRHRPVAEVVAGGQAPAARLAARRRPLRWPSPPASCWSAWLRPPPASSAARSSWRPRCCSSAPAGSTTAADLGRPRRGGPAPAGPRQHLRLHRRDLHPAGPDLLDGTSRVAAAEPDLGGGHSAGCVFRMFWLSAPRWLYTALYLVMGWAALGWLGAFYASGRAGGADLDPGRRALLHRRAPWSTAASGPTRRPRWFGFHEIFHAGTIAGFACHYVAISLITYAASERLAQLGPEPCRKLARPRSPAAGRRSAGRRTPWAGRRAPAGRPAARTPAGRLAGDDHRTGRRLPVGHAAPARPGPGRPGPTIATCTGVRGPDRLIASASSQPANRGACAASAPGARAPPARPGRRTGLPVSSAISARACIAALSPDGVALSVGSCGPGVELLGVGRACRRTPSPRRRTAPGRTAEQRLGPVEPGRVAVRGRQPHDTPGPARRSPPGSPGALPARPSRDARRSRPSCQCTPPDRLRRLDRGRQPVRPVEDQSPPAPASRSASRSRPPPPCRPGPAAARDPGRSEPVPHPLQPVAGHQDRPAAAGSTLRPRRCPPRVTPNTSAAQIASVGPEHRASSSSRVQA